MRRVYQVALAFALTILLARAMEKPQATGPGGRPGCGVGGGRISGVGTSAGGISGGMGWVLPGVGGVGGISTGRSGLSGMVAPGSAKGMPAGDTAGIPRHDRRYSLFASLLL